MASEAFVLPANAQNVKLRLEEFEALRGITLQLNGQIIASGGDDNDDTTMPAARFVPGKTNSLTLVLGPSGLAWQGSLLAELEASVSYDLAAAQTPPSTTSGSNVPVPEPPTALLMAIALAVLGAVAARRRA